MLKPELLLNDLNPLRFGKIVDMNIKIKVYQV